MTVSVESFAHHGAPVFPFQRVAAKRAARRLACRTLSNEDVQVRDRVSDSAVCLLRPFLIDCHIRELYYGEFKAVRDVALNLNKKHDHSLNRTDKMRQEHSAERLQPYE